MELFIQETAEAAAATTEKTKQQQNDDVCNKIYSHSGPFSLGYCFRLAFFPSPLISVAWTTGVIYTFVCVLCARARGELGPADWVRTLILARQGRTF